MTAQRGSSHLITSAVIRRKANLRLTVLFAAAVGLCIFCAPTAEAQLPSLIDLSAPPGLEVSPVLRVFGATAGDNLSGYQSTGLSSNQGSGLALGDFNGDSYADLLVGASNWDLPTPLIPTVGAAYIIYGGPGVHDANVFLNDTGSETRIEGSVELYSAGYSVAAGDVDRDGYDDAIIGEPGIGDTNPGRVKVIYGRPDLPGAVVNLEDPLIDPVSTLIVGELDPGNTSGLTGRAVASGDINGDGFDDVIVGSYFADTTGGTDVGAVYVVNGDAFLRGTTVTVGGVPGAGVARIFGDDPNDRFGWSVASGDVNGDGYDDVLTGAPQADPPGGTDAGECYVIYGKADFGGTIDLNTDGAVNSLHTRFLGDDSVSSPNDVDNFGFSIASGDVNGDGFHEVIVGARGATSPGRSRAGEVYVFYGNASLPNTIKDMNTSPNGAISATGETRLIGANGSNQTGYSVSAGDLTGDGRADVIMGTPNAQTPLLGTPGAVVIVPGASLPAATSVDLRAFPNKVEVRGAASFDLFGASAAGVGDLDRDGYGDFAGGAPAGDNPVGPLNDAGYAAVVFGDGSATEATATTRFSSEELVLKGIGGRLSAGVRTWVALSGSSPGTWVTSTLTRSDAGTSNIPDATPVDIANVVWHVTTNSPTLSGTRVVFRYTDSEVAGQNEANLRLYQAEALNGPWTLVNLVAFDFDRNEVSADVESLGYFALASDAVGPALSISAPSADVTRTNSVTYTITYTRATAITLSEDDITLNTTGNATATVGVSGSGTETRTVTLSNITGDGNIGISIAPGTATDASSNPAPAAGPSVPFRVDNTAPQVTIEAPSATATNTGPVTFTVTYAGASNVTLSSANINLVTTGTVNAAVAVSGDASSTSRLVTLSGISGNGTLGISIDAGTAVDEVGNAAAAAGPSATFEVDNTLTLAIGQPSATLVRNGSVTYTLTYTGATAVSLNTGNVTLNKTGSANGTLGVSGSGTTTRTVTVSNITGDGTLSISVALGTASDTVGNLAPAVGPSTAFTVDNTAPGIVIGAPTPTTTETGPVSFTVTYTGASSITLANANVTLIPTGSATGTVAVSGSGTATRTVTVSNISGTGTLAISIAAGTATDAAGNSALAAGPSTAVTVAVAPLVDVNNDTNVNATDLQLVINKYFGRTIVGNADVNRDGLVNATDIQLVINAILSRP